MWLAEGGGLFPGLPDLVNPNTSMMFWTFVTFIALVVVLGRFAWRPLLDALDKRERAIQDSLDSAAALKAEAEKVLDEYRRRVEAAHEEVKGIVEGGRRSAEALKDEIVGKARTEAKYAVDRATREIEIARESAIQEIRAEAVDLSITLASKVIERSLDRADHEKFLRSAMKELEL